MVINHEIIKFYFLVVIMIWTVTNILGRWKGEHEVDIIYFMCLQFSNYLQCLVFINCVHSLYLFQLKLFVSNQFWCLILLIDCWTHISNNGKKKTKSRRNIYKCYFLFVIVSAVKYNEMLRNHFVQCVWVQNMKWEKEKVIDSVEPPPPPSH